MRLSLERGERACLQRCLAQCSFVVYDTAESRLRCECVLGAETEAFQVLETGGHGFLGMGTCLSLSLIMIFPLPESLEALTSLGAPGDLALPWFHVRLEVLTIPALGSVP